CLHVRHAVVTGYWPSGYAAGSSNLPLPCWSARLPVAMLFHNMGPSSGRTGARLPQVPWSQSRASVGSAPSSTSGFSVFQSAACQPISSTLFGACFCTTVCPRGYHQESFAPLLQQRTRHHKSRGTCTRVNG